MSAALSPGRQRASRAVRRRRRRLGVLALVAAATAGVLVAVSSGGPPRLPLPGVGRPARTGDPFAYVAARAPDFQARAIAGEAHVLFAKSPGGIVATAARVAAWRPLIDRTAAGTGIDPNLLEGIVLLESAGRPDAIADANPAGASGLTQILAQTGSGLLGMHVDLPAATKLTARIDVALSKGRTEAAARLERRRAAVDDRFVPAKALGATIRYLKLAEGYLGGREDLAAVSYHMGIGNLRQVLAEYDGGRPVPYVQLFFDTAPDHHRLAYDTLSAFGDDSSLYYWRVLAAEQIMRLYRTDRPALARLAELQLGADSNALVLHPPGRTPDFTDPSALYAAYASRALLPLPANARGLGLAYGPTIGWLARRIGAPPRLYRGLRAPALDLLIELAARVRALSHTAAPLTVASAVLDRRYEGLLAFGYPAAASGYSFQIERRYASLRQADAFQAMLDRLTALDLIAWDRTPNTIDVTVASDASRFVTAGP